MANKKVEKVPFSRERFMQALNYRNSSIRKLGNVPEIERDEKTIRRYLHDGEIPPALLDRIGKYLDVHPDFLSGTYDRPVEHIEDETVRRVIKSQICVEDHPYFVKEQESLKYRDYFKSVLMMHNISIAQFKSLSASKRTQLQLDIEQAITAVIYKYFDCDATGKPIYPELERLGAELELASEDPESISPVDIFESNV
ncbi:MAG: hypothetical protein PT958_06515 [Firmicutes bacterium]|nr:hypothetical protein [Bacillota bacterium]